MENGQLLSGCFLVKYLPAGRIYAAFSDNMAEEITALFKNRKEGIVKSKKFFHDLFFRRRKGGWIPG